MIISLSENNQYTFTKEELAAAINALVAAVPGAEISDPELISSATWSSDKLRVIVTRSEVTDTEA